MREEEVVEEDLVLLLDLAAGEDGEWRASRCGVVGSAEENTIERSKEGGVLMVEDGAGEDEAGLGVAVSPFEDVVAGGDTTIILGVFALLRAERVCFFLDEDARGLFPSRACSTAGLPPVGYR
jgi:hypothetical protein